MGANCIKAKGNENHDAEVAASPHFSQAAFAQKLGKTNVVEGINGENEEAQKAELNND